jgi:uncharacterized membrane protein YphA (DoxX/SURF4 family)
MKGIFWMNVILWILQVLLAVVYVLHGWLYVTLSPATEERMRQRQPDAKPLGLPNWFRMFIGVSEFLAAAGLILPGITGILPWLTPLAVAGLMIVMAGAIVFHLSRQETPNLIASIVLFILVTFVAYMRWRIYPL